ncbi:hypothetical protein Ddye_008410 [Dipteronia dyeriana]|uniref:Reverse transcriptase n=1 Tax=Dipteronia dyeriana TaxID=168575 RepID=A0AAD9XAB4_9ROSI|nr:hypothetical protein Ddye_008410 [Dipteronia dyeriana]
MKRILRCLMASGLRINFNKSCLVKVSRKEHPEGMWADAFRCTRSTFLITYLVLPLGRNPRKEVFWDPIVNKIQQRVVPWKSSMMSKCGRLVMIKAVLLSLPTYFMSVFSIPSYVVRRIERLIRGFFWDDGIQKKKSYRGLGFVMQK